jgi:rhamnosyl/mannosyltransferase
LRILQIYKDYFPPVRGGIEGHINLLSNGLRERGVDVEVLVSNTMGKLDIETIDGITVTKVPQITRLASAPLNYSLCYWIKKIGKKFDLLHFHLPNPTAVLSYLMSGLKVKAVATYHSDIIRQRLIAKLYRPFLEIFLTKIDCIVATSPNYINTSKILRKYHQKCKVVPLGVNIARFKDQHSDFLTTSSIRQSYGNRILLFIGKFRYYKGLHILIEAMKQINGMLLLIGGGFLEQELKQQVVKNGLDKKIVFLGELSDQDVNNFLRTCDVFVLPSVERSEAFGIVQLEAMACGKPIVCTELGTGTSYVTQHQKNGIVVEPNQPSALAQAISYLLDNPDIRLRYGQAGIMRVEKYFSSDRMIDDIKALYEQYVNSI